MSDAVREEAFSLRDSSRTARIRYWLRHVLGLDRAVGFSVLARFWSSAAGLVTVALIRQFPFSGGAGILLHIWQLGRGADRLRVRFFLRDFADG